MTDETEGTGPRHEDEDFVTGSHFAKLYASILDSSVWEEAHATRLVWITLLVMCDADGFVEAADPGIYRRANVTPAEGKEALRILASPDVNSKSQEWGGRRIERVRGGWKILNYEKYRAAQTAKQKAAADRQARYRERKAAELEWRKANPGQDLPADWLENFARYVTPRNAQREREMEMEEVKSSSSTVGGAGGDVENSVDGVDNPPAGPEAAVLAALESELDRQAFRAIMAASPNPYAWAAELKARLDGMHPPQLSPRQLGEALRDYFANGHHERPSFKHFRAYLSRPDRPQNPPEETGGAAGPLKPAPNGPTGEAGAILARLKAGPVSGLKDETDEVRRAVEAAGGLAAIRECKPERWGLLVKDFAAHLAYARANPRPPEPTPAPRPAPEIPPEAAESPAMRRAREREEAWLAENPGQPLPKDFHLKPPPKK